MSRRLKVYYRSKRNTYGFSQRPQIILSGDWLERLGFAIGDMINLQCENGRIVISKE